MKKALEFIKENQMGYLATTDENSNPRVRAFSIMSDDEGVFFFGTSNKKNVYQQLKTNLKAEWISSSKSASTLRISGDVVFEDNRQTVMEFIEKTPAVKSMYQGRESEFELFYLENVEFNWFDMKFSL